MIRLLVADHRRCVGDLSVDFGYEPDRRPLFGLGEPEDLHCRPVGDGVSQAGESAQVCVEDLLADGGALGRK